MPNPRRIVVMTSKGGVGKTTTVATLAHVAGMSGRRVLAVDLDQQHDLTDYIGRSAPAASIADVLRDMHSADTIHKAIASTTAAGVDLIYGADELVEVELELGKSLSPTAHLRHALEHLKGDYDLMLIDCAPGMGLLNYNALVVADEVLLPVDSKPFALKKIEKVRQAIAMLKKGRLIDAEPPIRTVQTMYDKRIGLANDVRAMLEKYPNTIPSQQTIRINTKLAESTSFNKTIFDYMKRSLVANDYRKLAEEMEIA